MRTTLWVLGILLILVGTVFTLQGLNVLLGSFMSGRAEWAVIGIVLLFGGAGLLMAARRGRRRPH